MNTLTVSRWRYKGGAKHIGGFLRVLGIEFRTVKGQDFWQANAHLLHAIWKEVQIEARNMMRDLHPDAGGKSEEFRDFLESYDRVKLQFTRNMPPELPSDHAPSTILQIPAELKVRSRGKTFHAMRLATEGKRQREIAREIGVHPQKMRKLRPYLPPTPPCSCGRPTGHRQWCEHVLKRYPKRQYFLKEVLPTLPQNKPGFKQPPRSAEHNQKIASALKGRKLSASHIANSVTARKAAMAARMSSL